MGLSYSGELSLGALCPLAVTGAVTAAAELTTRLTLFASLQASLVLSPPTLAVNLVAAAELIVSLTASLTAVPPVPPFPSITLQLAGSVTAIAALEAQILILSPLMALLDEAGVFVYGFDGRTSILGPSVTSALATGLPGSIGPRANANALLLATVAPSTWDSMKTFFAGVPSPGPGAGLVYGGATSIGSLCPVVLRALFSVYSSMKARLSGLIAMVVKYTATLPNPVIAITDVVSYAAAVTAAIARGGPDAAFVVDAVAKTVTVINAAAALITKLQALFGAAGVFVYKYDGLTGQLGPSITSSLAGGWPNGAPPSAHANAILLGATTPATWTALQAFFGGA